MANSTLSGARIAVFGGSSGIGRAIGAEAAAAGAAVTLVGRDRGRLAAAADAFAAETAIADAGDEAAVAGFFAAPAAFDHIAISLAGNASFGPLVALDEAKLRLGMETKLFHVLRILRLGAPRLSERGSITIITGGGAGRPLPGSMLLTLTNGAIEASLATWAVELKPRRINSVAPGVIDTPAWSRMTPEQRTHMFQETARKALAGRVGQAEDVARAVLALMGNDFITGASIPCDGGLRFSGP